MSGTAIPAGNTGIISDEAISSRSLEFVTVVYRPEVPLLRLQARSFERHMDRRHVERIHILINEPEPRVCEDEVADIAANEYGEFSGRVKIWRAVDLLGSVSARGWRTQQILKLLISREIESEKYTVLDAKNHFIKEISEKNFLHSDGRPRSFWTAQDGSLRKFLVNSLRYMGLDEAVANQKVMPATTPFTLYTRAVKEMLCEIEAREGAKFEDVFLSPGRDLTEFFLYFGYLLKIEQNLDRIYRFGARNAVTLFTRWPDTAEQQDAVLRKLEEPNIVVFGLHKNRFAVLDDDARAKVYRTWVQSRLFDSESQAAAFYEHALAAIQASSTNP